MVFWLQKMQPTKRNYRVGKSKMLAIVEACKHWQHYLETVTYKVCMITDYCNLRMFLTTKNLTRHKTRWLEQFSGLDMKIKYCLRKKNPANSPSQHLNYIDTADNKEENVRTTVYTVPNRGTAHVVQCISSPVSNAHQSDPSVL